MIIHVLFIFRSATPQYVGERCRETRHRFSSRWFMSTGSYSLPLGAWDGQDIEDYFSSTQRSTRFGPENGFASFQQLPCIYICSCWPKRLNFKSWYLENYSSKSKYNTQSDARKNWWFFSLTFSSAKIYRVPSPDIFWGSQIHIVAQNRVVQNSF